MAWLQNRLLSDVVERNYAGSSLPSGNGQPSISGGIQIPVPDSLAPFHLASSAERARRVRDVLLMAHRVYRRGGISLVNSVNEAATSSAVGEYAKISLRRVLLELNLDAWESHPNRTRDDVHRLFRKTIGRLTPHRGGWRVTR